MNYNEKFLKIIKENVRREGIIDLCKWLTTTDFFIAPASTRFHEAYKGGLVEHSVCVYEQLIELVEFYGLSYSNESIAIVSLFHDLCKCNMYATSERNVKDEKTGTWHKEPYYTIDEQLSFGGHGSKSVFLIMQHMKLEDFEAAAINCHMGVENGKWEVCDAFRKNPLAYLLHVADMASTIPELKEIVSGGE